MSFLSPGTRIVFILPGFSPLKPNQGVFSTFHRTGVVRQSDSRVVHVALDVPLSPDDIAAHADLATTVPKGQALTTVILPHDHVLGAYPYEKQVPLPEAYRQGGPFHMPLPFVPQAKVSIAMPYEHRSVATVMSAMHHIGCYDVQCTDSAFARERLPGVQALPARHFYRIPAKMVAYGCNPEDLTTGRLPSIRTQLRRGVWCRLQCFKVNNVVKRAFSTHRDGNKTHNLAGHSQLVAAYDDASNKVALSVQYEPFEPQDLEDDTLPERTDALAHWRYYCGFTESVPGNPTVTIPADESHDGQAHTEPRGHYFDTRNYAELDFAHGTLELVPRYMRRGYPMPNPGDWVCGIVGHNHMGTCLTQWFVCSPALKELIDYVQQPERTLNVLPSGSLRTNSYLDTLQSQLAAADTAVAKKAWVGAFNDASNRDPVRSESTSRAVNRDVYATVLHLLVEEEANFEPLDAYTLDLLAEAGVVNPHESVLSNIHDIDPFRILVYYRWWQRHDKPERPKANPNRLQRYLDAAIETPTTS